MLAARSITVDDTTAHFRVCIHTVLHGVYWCIVRQEEVAHHGKSYERQDCSGLCNDLGIRGEQCYQLTLQVHHLQPSIG